MTKEPKVLNWSLAQLWNEVAYKEDRPLQKRDYVYASEIGMPFYDRYLKMKAVEFTNPPNNRSLRKFLAGNIWEYTVKQILVACGVFKQEEVKIDAEPYSDCLPVHGRCDFIAGGYIDYELAVDRLRQLALPDYLSVIGDKILTALEGKTLEKKILELKAVSTFAMDKVERMGEPMPNHSLQGYHYQKNGKIPADVGYICKDDCRMAQFSIVEEHTEPLYRKDLEQMTFHFSKKKPPPLAPLVSFDNVFGKFVKNLYVEYSPYLRHYGFEDPDDYRKSISYIDKWNRALNRFVLAATGKTTPTGKPIVITPKNKDMQAEIIKAGHNFNDLLQLKIDLGADEEVED
jgi:hypothetical protein